MANQQKLLLDIELVDSLKTITEAYQELSVMKMQKIRSFVLNTRNFLSKLSEVFVDVKSSHTKQVIKLMKEKNKKNINLPKKTANVLLSANTKLYGQIVFDVFNTFFETIKKEKADIIIIGRLGKQLFDEKKINKKYLYFDLPDTSIGLGNIKPIIYHINKYTNINVFHGRFENLFVQKPTVSNVSGQPSFDQKNTKTEEKFFFEPDLKKIVDFFSTQIFTSLFKQTIHESELSRLASRIKSMDEALRNINTRMKHLYIQKQANKRALENKNQIETVSRIFYNFRE